jgi:hypothetical protein
VVPVCYEERDAVSWWMRLRCGGCGFVRELVASDEAAQDLADELEAAREEILIALERLRLGRVPEQVGALEHALAHGSPPPVADDVAGGAPGAPLVLRRIAMVVAAGVALLVLLLVAL